MYQRLSKSVFIVLPLCIFAIIFSWRWYARATDLSTNQLRASMLAEQLSTALTIVGADRIRALDALVTQWPMLYANQVDWFNVQGRSMMKTLPGIYDLYLFDPQAELQWSVKYRDKVPHQMAIRSLLQQRQNGALLLLESQPYVYYVVDIIHEQRLYWSIVMLLDPQAIIAAFSSDWQNKPVAFAASLDGQALFTFGQFQPQLPQFQNQVGFAGNTWTLNVQSIDASIASLANVLFSSLALCMVICFIALRWQGQRAQIQALNHVYRTAADVSEAAMFIFKQRQPSKSQEFYLFSCNAAAKKMLNVQSEHEVSIRSLAQFIQVTSLVDLMQQVQQTQQPYTQLRQTPPDHWYRLQLTPMPSGVVCSVLDVSLEQQLQQKIVYQANHDQLTGLLNRYAFSAELLAAANAQQQSFLCYVDMDHFKVVNDSCGHVAGDELLKATAVILSSVLAPDDKLARVGGDEFCILLQNTSLASVQQRLKNLLQKIEHYRFKFDNQTFGIGASIGVIGLQGKTSDVRQLMMAADAGCYLAKSNGRNRYFIVDEQTQALNHLENERHHLQIVRQALQNNSFRLFAQPIKSLQADPSCHFEVLLRLFDAQGNAISPALFIPLAERQGLITQIDVWVLQQVLQALATQQALWPRLGKVSINISGISLDTADFLREVKIILQQSGVPASLLCFEITETAAVTNLAQAQLFFKELRALGYAFALDDFGVGMSSFAYLRDMPVDYVKIDGTFVKNMVKNQTDAVMVQAINNIAHSLGKKTIAEFVADEATAAALQAMGVEYGQGFGLGHPVPLEAMFSAIAEPSAPPES
jgi:diguanylate cyclase (GGDEF)-like protein